MSTNERPRRSLPRRILRVVLGIFGAFVFLLVAGIGALHTSGGKAWVRGRIERAIAPKLNGSLTLGELDYSLFGDLAVGKLVVRDEHGVEALTLDEVRLAPLWTTLTGDAPALERLTVRGVHVHVIEREDGSTNLDHLARQKPSGPKGKGAPPKSKLAELRLAAFSIDDVSVLVDRVDGSHAHLALTHAEGAITLRPSTDGLELSIPKVAIEAGLDAKTGASFALRNLETSASAHVTDGAGDVVVGPTRARIELQPEGAPARGFDLDLGAIETHVSRSDLKLVATRMLLGAIEARAIEMGRDKGAPNASHGSLGDLHIDAAKLNELAGKRLLAADLDVDAKIDGPKDKLVLSGAVRGGGALVAWRGEFDLSHAERPSYVLHLDAKDLDATRLAGEDVHAPPARIEKITLDVTGSGTKRDDAEVEAKLEVLGVTAKQARIEAIRATGRLSKGEVRVRELEVTGLGQTLRGEATFGLEDKKLHLQLSPSGRGRDLAEALRSLGLASPPALATIAIAPEAGTIAVDGEAGGPLHAVVAMKHVAIGGGAIDVDADASLTPNPKGVEPAMRIENVRARISLTGVDVGSLAPRPLPASAILSGHVDVSGTPEAPGAHADLVARVRARGESSRAALVDVHADIDGARAKLHLAARGEGGASATPLFVADALVPLDGKTLALDRPLDVRVDLPHRPFAELAEFAPEGAAGKLPPGEVELHARVGGTARRPEGRFDLDLIVAALGGEKQRVHVDGLVHPSKSARGGTAIEADARAWLKSAGVDAPPAARSHVEVDLQGLGPRSPLAWSVGLDVPELQLASLPLPPERLGGATGSLAAHAKLHGTRDDLGGDVEVLLGDLKRDGKGPLAARIALAVDDARTHLDLGVRVKETPILAVRGAVGLGGRGLLASLREKRALDPALDLAIEVPDAALADLAPLAPALASAPGHLHGAGTLRGNAKSPALALGVGLDHYATIDGRDGRVALDIAADPSRAEVKVGIGNADDTRAVAIDAKLPLKGGDGLFGIPEAKATARADDVDLRSIVPGVLLGGRRVDVAGRLAWDMKGDFSVKPTLHGIGLKAKVEGDLALTKGRVGLVGTRPCAGPSTHLCTDRTIDRIELKLETDANELHLTRFGAHEADIEKPDRTIELRGTLGWADLTPDRADLTLDAHDWLLFGADKLGPADAPRGSLTAKVKIGADLDGPIKTVNANVQSLDLRVPDRFDRSHQPEVVSLGDVLYLGAPGVMQGKLPQPPIAEAPAPEKPESADHERDEHGLDVHVRLEKRIHVEQAPLDLQLEGGVDVTTRGASRRVRGKLVAVGGSLLLGGKRHTLDHGAVTFDEAHPGGMLDLHFARPLPAETLRDISAASGGDAVRIDMAGPLGKQKVSLHGAGNGTLFDVLAVDNGGRERFVSAPDLPTSETVQLPRHDDLLAFTFLSVNLPHLLFLDRLSAWADPYESQSSYGRVHDVDAEKTSESGHTRVRAVERAPQHPGESTNELELDGLFWNTRRSDAGIGLTAGDRGGGGPVLFWEWVSGD